MKSIKNSNFKDWKAIFNDLLKVHKIAMFPFILLAKALFISTMKRFFLERDGLVERKKGIQGILLLGTGGWGKSMLIELFLDSIQIANIDPTIKAEFEELKAYELAFNSFSFAYTTKRDAYVEAQNQLGQDPKITAAVKRALELEVYKEAPVETQFNIDLPKRMQEFDIKHKKFVESNISCFLDTVGKTTTEDHFKGGINFSAMNRVHNAKILYNYSKSMFTKEIAFVEELLDARFAIESLKQTMTSGKVTSEGVEILIDLRLLIGASNMTLSEFKENPSLEALGQRFNKKIECCPDPTISVDSNRGNMQTMFYMLLAAQDYPSVEDRITTQLIARLCAKYSTESISGRSLMRIIDEYVIMQFGEPDTERKKSTLLALQADALLGLAASKLKSAYPEELSGVLWDVVEAEMKRLKSEVTPLEYVAQCNLIMNAFIKCTGTNNEVGQRISKFKSGLLAPKAAAKEGLQYSTALAW
jgi:hypothetical protein